MNEIVVRCMTIQIKAAEKYFPEVLLQNEIWELFFHFQILSDFKTGWP